METKYITIPFDLEMAKRITNKEEDGKIVTRNGESVRILAFDRKDEYRPIIALVNNGEMEFVYALDIDGKESAGGIIGKRDLLISVPELPTFKDGDFLTSGKGFVFIHNGKSCDIQLGAYVGETAERRIKIAETPDRWTNKNTCRFSTTNEKETFLNRLQKELGLQWNPETKLLEKYQNHSNSENIGKEYNLEPFQKVLCRDNVKNKWTGDLFLFKENDGRFYCVRFNWSYCIPYNEQTKHLLNTNENWEDEK